jgi:hypothetical protein
MRAPGGHSPEHCCWEARSTCWRQTREPDLRPELGHGRVGKSIQPAQNVKSKLVLPQNCALLQLCLRSSLPSGDNKEGKRNLGYSKEIKCVHSCCAPG